METTSRPAATLDLNPDAVRAIVTRFVRDEVTHAGFSRAVLGLSGGVDSALVAMIAAKALGPENVLGVKMPYKSSSAASRSDADAVADAAGIRTETVDITPMADPHFAAHTDMNNLRRGNVMARQRMIVLFDLSARDKALVLGTSNKTELLLGYGTQFGDLASALNPVGDLYKTQVWQLAREFGVPAQVVDKKPTADLWEGQTDEAELGFTYASVDILLHHMIDERLTDGELVTLGFEPAFIVKVRRLVQLNQYKRRPPLIAKISHRTINVDFRYPRDWGT